jgi:hypothetical protein
MYFYYKETAVENQERNDELKTAGNCISYHIQRKCRYPKFRKNHKQNSMFCFRASHNRLIGV